MTVRKVSVSRTRPRALTSRSRRSRRSRRLPPRDARGRFTSTGAASTADDEDSDDTGTKRKHRRRTVVAGSAVAIGVAATQAHPASRTRTAITRAKIVRKHVARAKADHERHTSRRNRVFPTEATRARRFDAKAARREGRQITKGYRKQVKAVRKTKAATKRKRATKR